MLTEEIEIINKLGLHARSAAKLVNTANSFASKITIHYAGQTADAKSIMSLMMLAAAQGSVITVNCEGDDQQAAMQAVQELIDNRFGEDE